MLALPLFILFCSPSEEGRIAPLTTECARAVTDFGARMRDQGCAEGEQVRMPMPISMHKAQVYINRTVAVRMSMHMYTQAEARVLLAADPSGSRLCSNICIERLVRHAAATIALRCPLTRRQHFSF